MRNRLILIFVVATVLCVERVTPSPAITNGGFETGTFSDWDTAGITGVVGSFAGGPTEGTLQAQIETGDENASAKSAADLETFLGLNAGSLAALGNGTPTFGSAIKQAFAATIGDVLSFDWNFLTGEDVPTSFNDFSFVTLLSLSTLANANSSTLISFGGGFFNRHTEFQGFSAIIPSSGIYTLGLGVVHVGDDRINSGLLIDNVSLTSDTSVVPEPSTLLLFGAGLVGLVCWRRTQAE